MTNSSVSFGGITLSLGDSDATPAFDLTDAINYSTSNLSGTITNAQLAGSIANNKLERNWINGTASTEICYNSGSVGINKSNPGSYKFWVNGHVRMQSNVHMDNNATVTNLTVNGTFTNNSDSRAKLNQELYDTSNCLYAINNISIKKYDYAPWFKVEKEQYKTDLSDNVTVDLSYVGLPRTGVIGFIAQDLLDYDATRGIVTKSYAAFSDTSNNSVEFDDFHRVDKSRLITVLMGAIQEQQKIIDAEKTKTATLESQVSDLLSRVTALENANN